jgi:hypothetical protein
MKDGTTEHSGKRSEAVRKDAFRESTPSGVHREECEGTRA